MNSQNAVFTGATGYPYVDGNNRTQVPLRVTMESAGATVAWDQASKTATVEKRGVVVKIPIGADYILVDGVKKQNDTAAVVKDGRTYLPLRAVLEALKFSVEWDGKYQAVYAANYIDSLQQQDVALEAERQNIKTTADLIDYYRSSWQLEKEVVRALAEQESMNRMLEKATPTNLESFTKREVNTVAPAAPEWYTEDLLQSAGVTVDDSGLMVVRLAVKD